MNRVEAAIKIVAFVVLVVMFKIFNQGEFMKLTELNEILNKYWNLKDLPIKSALEIINS